MAAFALTSQISELDHFDIDTSSVYLVLKYLENRLCYQTTTTQMRRDETPEYVGQKFTMPFTSAREWPNGGVVHYLNKDANNWSEMTTYDYTTRQDANKPGELV